MACSNNSQGGRPLKLVRPRTEWSDRGPRWLGILPPGGRGVSLVNAGELLVEPLGPCEAGRYQGNTCNFRIYYIESIKRLTEL